MLNKLFFTLMIVLVPFIKFSYAQNLSPEQEVAIDKRIEQYIVNNPDIVIEALRQIQIRENKQKAQTVAAKIQLNSKNIYNDGYSYVGGNPNGKLTLVEFLDYQCGFCKKAHPVITQFLKENPDIRYIVKEFPVLGEKSRYAAQAALAAVTIKDGRYYKSFHNNLMTYKGALNNQAVLDLADDAGLDTEELQNAMQSPDIIKNIRTTYTLAKELNISGTPYFIFNDQILPGVPTRAILDDIVQSYTASPDDT